LGERNNKQFYITSARSGMQTFVPEISKVTAAGLSDPVIRILIGNSPPPHEVFLEMGQIVLCG